MASRVPRPRSHFRRQESASARNGRGQQRNEEGRQGCAKREYRRRSEHRSHDGGQKSVWEAWKAKDAKKLEELTTADLSFQNIYGAYFANKADTLKNWTWAYCDIKSVSVADGAGTLLSPKVGILSRTGTAEGTCNGQNLPPVPIYGTSVYVKDGDSWRLAFSLNRLD